MQFKALYALAVALLSANMALGVATNACEFATAQQRVTTSQWTDAHLS